MHAWDMRMRRCLSRHVDEGCFSSTALAAAADSSLYATGSKAGVVNIYSYPQRSAPDALHSPDALLWPSSIAYMLPQSISPVWIKPGKSRLTPFSL